MSDFPLTYETNRASHINIFDHLNQCDKNFIRQLSSRVDLSEYANKLSDFSLTFEAWSGFQLIGLVAAYMNDRKSDSVFISNVTVLPAYSGKGVASNLLNNCTNAAREKGFKQVFLEVYCDNEIALQFYLKHKFSIISSANGINNMALRLN